ncbi:MAG: protein kinase [Gammaproteobacteria bacterium]
METRQFSTARIQKGMNYVPLRQEPPEEKDPLLITPTNFKFDTLIGRGTYGCVYKEKYLEKDVAVKSFSLQKNLNKELSILKKLKPSSFIPKLYGYYLSHDKTTQSGGIIMEFVPRSLHDILQENKRKAINRKSYYKIARFAARALHSLHQQDLIHFDIKPANLMVCSNNQVKIIDFGFAQFGNLSEYEAPEFTDMFQLRKKADIYSLGVVLWEMASGKSPRNILAGESFTIPKSCPEKFSTLIIRCIDKDPRARPSAEFIDHYLNSALAELALNENVEIEADREHCECLSM